MTHWFDRAAVAATASDRGLSRRGALAGAAVAAFAASPLASRGVAHAALRLEARAAYDSCQACMNSAIRAKVSDHGIELVLLAEDFEIARSFGIGGLPGAIALDADGNVAGAPVHGANEVLPLLLSAAADELRLVEVNGG